MSGAAAWGVARRMRRMRMASASRAADGERRTRTADTSIFSRVLYQLSYLAATPDPTVRHAPWYEPSRWTYGTLACRL